MLHWLKRFGLRLWRSCCYPVQRIAALGGGQSKVHSPVSGQLPKPRGEAIRDGALMLPEDSAVVDWLPAEEFSGAAFSVLAEHDDQEVGLQINSHPVISMDSTPLGILHLC